MRKKTERARSLSILSTQVRPFIETVQLKSRSETTNTFTGNSVKAQAVGGQVAGDAVENDLSLQVGALLSLLPTFETETRGVKNSTNLELDQGYFNQVACDAVENDLSLQVGALLSLLPTFETETRGVKNSTNLELDQGILQYFFQAATICEKTKQSAAVRADVMSMHGDKFDCIASDDPEILNVNQPKLSKTFIERINELCDRQSAAVRADVMSMHGDKFDCIASDDPVNTQCEPTKIVEIPGRVTHSLSEQMSYAIDSADSSVSISGFDIYEDQDKTSKGPNEVLSDPHLRSESARSNNESEQPLLSTAISNDQSDLGSVLESRSIVENRDILEDEIRASSSCFSPSHGPEGSSEHELPSEEIGEINSDEEDDAEENEMDDDNAEVEDVEEEVESDILGPDNEIEDDVLNNEDDGIHDMEDDDNENEDGDDEEVMLQQALALSLAEHNARTTRSSESSVNTRQDIHLTIAVSEQFTGNPTAMLSDGTNKTICN
eukprot:CAMPEP_0194443428 /NCGR_PEP_ID=MMETSP0176-20130528/126700_1 /TAXON_ID=216777 /ORGANISM="Proboscia alata, Strain PI-D3" /LENGTH=494 /DNA_ID=CAMNT_0039269675 /DNA_START=569 /DNA_END=2053 /DNA_ORIENTATION=-